MHNMSQIQDELMHYGVLGMHWGYSGKQAGRELRKGVHQDRRKMMKQERAKAYKELGIAKKWEDVRAYGVKNHLDLDDGGGGSLKAGRHYEKLTIEAGLAEEKMHALAKKNTTDRLIKKYGQTKLEAVKKHDMNEQKVIGVSILAGLASVPVIAALVAS